MFSVRHPVSVLMVVLATVFCSLISTNIIQSDFVPKMDEHFILISSDFSGLNASEMRKLVTIPIEDSVASLKGVKNISSTTRDSVSLILIELQFGIDSKMALSECRQLIDQCYEVLPTGVSKPDVIIYNPTQKETLSLIINVKDGDLKYARYICDNDIKGRLQRIQGIATVGIHGGEKEEIHVLLDKTKIESLRLSIENISEILSYANFEYPAGTIKNGNKDILFKTKGLFASVDDILNVPISFQNEQIIHLGNIGTVKEGVEKKKSFNMYNGQEVICINLYKKSDISPLSVSNAVKKEIKKLNDLYGNNLEFKIISDTSEELKDSFVQLFYSAIVGIVITLVILLIFFRRFSIALLAASIMPITILFSILILYLAGKTVNILSISGIAIGLGMVIDPAIVTIENVLKNLKINRVSQNKFEIVIRATENVSLSSFGSAITTVIVFIPFFFLPGITGKLFSDMATAVISSISFACFLSLTFVPSILTLYIRINKLNDKAELNISKIENFYSEKLRVVFKKKIVIPLILAICIICGSFCIKILSKEILPKKKSSYTVATVLYKDSMSIEKLLNDSLMLSRELKKYNFVTDINISGGVEKDDLKILTNPQFRKEMLTIKCRTTNERKCKKLIESLFSTAEHEIFFNENKDIISQLFQVDSSSRILSDETPERLNEKLERLKKQEPVSKVVPSNTVYEYVFVPDRAACSRFGVSAVKMAKLARDNLEGVYSSPLYKNGREIPVLVKYPEKTITTSADLENSIVILKDSYIPFSSLGHIDYSKSEKIFYRYNRKDSKRLVFTATENELSNREKTFLLFGLKNPGKEEIEYLFKDSLFLLAIILILLYCVMGAQFESFLIPILILFAIPPAFSGAFMALFLTGQSINLNSIIALVVLFGTSVNNSILLYEAILLENSITVENVIKASVSKLRSILVTTVTTVFALIPFTFDFNGTNTQNSMAIAIIGGLSLSLIIVLFIIPPILYMVLRNKKLK
ncbi:efflux RND transporter permease subunit [Treponema zioleckii]|uniref:efflux RND transporter permease subunit n=1 Tax=Treponema zioleckii TaxID=331680 RepID=UPI00168A948F|nr:efflux RND transporter permease subunit [Treponema zioleckii]